MKRKLELLFILMAAIMLSMATDTMAQQNTCNLVQISGSGTSPTTYSIKFVGVTPCTNCGGSGKDGFQWDYELISSPGSITQLNMLTPVCSQDLGVFVYSGGQILSPGIGDPTTMFGVGDFQYQVDRLALNASPHFYLGVSRETGQTPTSMQFRVSKNLYYCPSIPGPDCPQPGFIPVNLSAKIKVGPGEVCVTKDPATGCINDVFECDGSYHYPLSPIQDFQVGQSSIQWAGSDSEQRCPTVILYTESSFPRCYPLLSGGAGCQKCYCCTNTHCQSKGLSACIGFKAGCSEANAATWGSCQ